jgi:hypothetical protein
VVLDSECRVDAKQELTFGFYRVLELTGTAYEPVEEGAFFHDDSLLVGAGCSKNICAPVFPMCCPSIHDSRWGAMALMDSLVEEKRMPSDEWIKTLADGRKVKFPNLELLDKGRLSPLRLRAIGLFIRSY